MHATPVDIDRQKTVIENWTAHLNADNLVDVFGNIPGWLLNLAFLSRNPLEAMLKYPRYFSEPRSLDEIAQFFAIEMWLSVLRNNFQINGIALSSVLVSTPAEEYVLGDFIVLLPV